MKIITVLIFFFCSFAMLGQTPEEQRFLDTLKTGGLYIIGKSMPEFNLRSINGHVYSKKKLLNKITFINLWFEACLPCIAEMEALNNLYSDFRKFPKFQFLSFTFEKKENIKKIAKKYRNLYPIISTTLDSCTKLNFGRGFPTTIITDNTGKIIYFDFGGAANPEKAKESFKTKIYPVLNGLLKTN